MYYTPAVVRLGSASGQDESRRKNRNLFLGCVHTRARSLGHYSCRHTHTHTHTYNTYIYVILTRAGKHNRKKKHYIFRFLYYIIVYIVTFFFLHRHYYSARTSRVMIIGDRDFLRLTTSQADAMTSNPSINRVELHYGLRATVHYNAGIKVYP